MKVQTKHKVSVAFIEKNGWGNNKKCVPKDIVNSIKLKQLYYRNELGYMPVILFDHFYRLLWESFPIVKWSVFSQFYVF